MESFSFLNAYNTFRTTPQKKEAKPKTYIQVPHPRFGCIFAKQGAKWLMMWQSAAAAPVPCTRTKFWASAQG
jgi:hypothetical protein